MNRLDDIKSLSLMVLARHSGSAVATVPASHTTRVGTHGTGQSESFYDRRLKDAYYEATSDALREISAMGWPVGAMAWLRENSTGLYGQLTAKLTHDIDALWDAGVSLRVFLDALTRLVETSRIAISLYRQHNPTQQ